MPEHDHVYVLVIFVVAKHQPREDVECGTLGYVSAPSWSCHNACPIAKCAFSYLVTHEDKRIMCVLGWKPSITEHEQAFTCMHARAGATSC